MSELPPHDIELTPEVRKALLTDFAERRNAFFRNLMTSKPPTIQSAKPLRPRRIVITRAISMAVGILLLCSSCAYFEHDGTYDPPGIADRVWHAEHNL